MMSPPAAVYGSSGMRGMSCQSKLTFLKTSADKFV
jgi:hypothetical protein